MGLCFVILGEMCSARAMLSKFILINKNYQLLYQSKQAYIFWIILILNITMRVLLNTTRYYYKMMPQVPKSGIEKPQSNIIVEPGFFRQKGFINNFIHKFKNNNALTEAKRNISDFSNSQFEKQTLNKYRTVYQLYLKRNFREINPFISQQLAKIFKAECKAHAKGKQFQLDWGLIPDVNQVQIVQVLARVHQNKLSTMRVIERWFQITCSFKNAKGQQMFNVLQKHEKNKDFKFVRFNL